jgi:hypothetical protein
VVLLWLLLLLLLLLIILLVVGGLVVSLVVVFTYGPIAYNNRLGPVFQKHLKAKFIIKTLVVAACLRPLVEQLKAKFIIKTLVGASLNLRAVSQNHSY